jgi:hypothetical protein
VFIDDLENCRVVDDSIEQDPFEPCDPPTEPEYDEYQEWQQMTSELRRGEA